MPIISTRCLRISGKSSRADAGRVIGAITSGFAAFAFETAVERSDGGSGHGMASTVSHDGGAALWAPWNPHAVVSPKMSVQYMKTTRLSDTVASLNMSFKHWTTFDPKRVQV